MKLKYTNPFTIWINPIPIRRISYPIGNLVGISHTRIYWDTKANFVESNYNNQFHREYYDGTIYAFYNLYTIK
jgi:hypothetical protein